jgi:hypothetical protein
VYFGGKKNQSFKTEPTTSTIRVNIFEPVCQTFRTVSYPTETTMLKQQKQLIADCVIRNIRTLFLLQYYMSVKEKKISFSGTMFMINNIYDAYYGGTAVARCLRYCATNQKVAGSIPDGITGIFH